MSVMFYSSLKKVITLNIYKNAVSEVIFCEKLFFPIVLSKKMLSIQKIIYW